MGQEPSGCWVLQRKARARRTAFFTLSAFCPCKTYRERPVAKASLLDFFD
jgi:hypothetical protein